MLTFIVGLSSFITAHDIKFFRIPSSLVSLLGGIGFYLHGLTHLHSFILSSLIALIAHYGPREPYIGKGDIKFMAAASLFIPFSFLDIFFTIMGITGVISGLYSIKYKGESYFPFAPSISFALIYVILLAG